MVRRGRADRRWTGNPRRRRSRHDSVGQCGQVVAAARRVDDPWPRVSPSSRSPARPIVRIPCSISTVVSDRTCPRTCTGTSPASFRIPPAAIQSQASLAHVLGEVGYDLRVTRDLTLPNRTCASATPITRCPVRHRRVEPRQGPRPLRHTERLPIHQGHSPWSLVRRRRPRAGQPFVPAAARLRDRIRRARAGA